MGTAGAAAAQVDTPVATPRGERAIAALKAGDPVVAYDPATGHATTQTVEATHLNHDTDLLDVTLNASDRATNAASAGGTPRPSATSRESSTASAAVGRDETVHTTDTHRWYTADRGWLPASFLRVGEPVVRADGAAAMVIRLRTVPGAAAMYDLTVSQVHTYAVGVGEYVVHNTSPGAGCFPEFQVHIDSQAKPIGVDTSVFTHGTPTARGGIRDAEQFWETYARKYPAHISPTNASRISQGLAPEVDAVWTNYYPEHAPYMNGKLIHHRLEQGPFAIALPDAIHRFRPWFGIWHS